MRTLLLLTIGAALVMAIASLRDRHTLQPPAEMAGLIGSIDAPAADARGISERIAAMEARLAERPDDSAAAVILAEALVRQARVTGIPAFSARAEQRLRETLTRNPADYNAQRMLGVVLLSLHRFDEAIAAGRHAHDLRPDDAFNFGVIGDGLLETGQCDAAYAAFQQMMDLRPNAASYARASYALELQGRLAPALDAMQRAVGATSPRDVEGRAWAMAHVGNLLLQLDHLDDAEVQYRAALKLYPDHPSAIAGLAKLYQRRHRDADANELADLLLKRVAGEQSTSGVRATCGRRRVG